MNKIKCFLIEKTDKWHTVKGTCGCGNPECYSYRSPIYRRVDTGQEGTRQELGPGAMWFGDPNDYGLEYRGLDGKTLFVAIPDGSGTHAWMVDARASNCTKKDDKIHKCWCRHGDAPNITVDKNGNTCAAGAGSILIDTWHGFLRNGYLESC